MTISQALRRIAKLKGELKEQLERAAAVVTYQSPPAFKFSECVDRATAVREELIKLEARLRITNALTNVMGMTLAEATCRLQEYKSHIAWLRALKVQPQEEVNQLQQAIHNGQYVNVPITTRCDLPEAERAGRIQVVQEAFDRLNDLVETANHRTDLVEGLRGGGGE